MTTAIATNPKWNVLTSEPAGGPTWKELHKNKWGGNDIASIMGVGFKSRLKLWGESAGHLEPEDISRKPHIRLGTLLEPIVFALYEEERGQKIMPTPGLVQHPELDYVACTPDGLIQREGGALSIFSAKTYNVWKRKEWDVDVPLRAQVQAHAEMWVLGLDFAIYAGLCRDGDVEEDDREDDREDGDFQPANDGLILWAERERRNDLIQMIGEEVVAFRELVQKDTPPDPNGDFETAKALYKKHQPGSVVSLPAEYEIKILRNKELASMRTQAKKEQDALKAEIMLKLAEAEYGETPGGLVVRARTQNGGNYFVEPYTSRPLIMVKKVGA